MKSVVLGNTNRALFSNGINLPAGTPNTSSASASTKILPEDPKHAATPAARKKRKAEDIDAGVVKASKKVKTKEPKQQSELEGFEAKDPVEQSNLDFINQPVQSSSNDPHPAPKIAKSRRNESSHKDKEVPTGFDRFRNGGPFCSNVPAEKSAKHTRLPIPLFSKESAESIDCAADQKDTPDARSPYEASSKENATSAVVVKSPKSVSPDPKPYGVPDVTITSKVGDRSVSNQDIASVTSKKAAAATSSEIRSWMSTKPTKIPGLKNVGSCDKMHLPGTDTKLLPCHLMYVLECMAYEPRSAADQETIKAALAPCKEKMSSLSESRRKDSSPDEPKPVETKVGQKIRKIDDKSGRITKKQPGKKRKGSEQKKVKSKSSSQDSQPRQRQDASTNLSALASPPEMPHPPAI